MRHVTLSQHEAPSEITTHAANTLFLHYVLTDVSLSNYTASVLDYIMAAETV